jgi:hypothetical protein
VAAEPTNQIMEADARHLAEKLAALEVTLSPAEQILLRTVMRRAAVISEELEEYLALDRLIRIVIGDGGPH